MKKKNRFLSLVAFVVLALTPSPAKSEESDTSGTKVLTAFNTNEYYVGDQESNARKEFDTALEKSKVRILKTYDNNRYKLLDCGAQNPEEVMAKIPHHAGAIVFSEGKFVIAIASPDKMKAFDGKGGKKRIPAEYAVLRWGSTESARNQMEADTEKYSKMEGVDAKLLSSAPGQEDQIGGNPWFLKLTPGEGKTLLDVFLLAEGQFDY